MRAGSKDAILLVADCNEYQNVVVIPVGPKRHKHFLMLLFICKKKTVENIYPFQLPATLLATSGLSDSLLGAPPALVTPQTGPAAQVPFPALLLLITLAILVLQLTQLRLDLGSNAEPLVIHFGPLCGWPFTAHTGDTFFGSAEFMRRPLPELLLIAGAIHSGTPRFSARSRACTSNISAYKF